MGVGRGGNWKGDGLDEKNRHDPEGDGGARVIRRWSRRELESNGGDLVGRVEDEREEKVRRKRAR